VQLADSAEAGTEKIEEDDTAEKNRLKDIIVLYILLIATQCC